MGVIGTYCQLCGLPIQHDHYVTDSLGGGMLKIYRGSAKDGGHAWAAEDDVFQFTADHAWLRDGVSVSFDDGPVLRGPVEDGVLADTKTKANAFVGEGMEDAMALHARCWELSGSPATTDDATRGMDTKGWELVEPYQGQLFDFQKFRDDGHGELLRDPASSPVSGKRVRGMLEEAKDA